MAPVGIGPIAFGGTVGVGIVTTGYLPNGVKGATMMMTSGAEPGTILNEELVLLPTGLSTWAIEEAMSAVP
jgi:hypothetical protein